MITKSDAEPSRRIVLEGRVGFSRISGGLLPKTQLFIRGDGELLIAGQPGRSFQMSPATLAGKPLVMPQGFGIAGVNFAPDGGPVALAAINPQTQQGGVVIADLNTGTSSSIPTGAQFLRWLEKDEMLLKVGSQLVRHPMKGLDKTYGAVAGCPGALGGSVIPGTDIHFVSTPEGKTCIQKDSEPPREVMAGVGANKFGAVANDLSMFGGVDAEKRLWVQHGLDGKPEMVAAGAERVLWGPISRRVLVVDAKQQGRIYDGRTRTWIDLGLVAAAQWSPDEERLIFLEAVENGYVSTVIGTKIERLVPLSIMGSLTGMAVTDAGDKAFMLAGITGGLDVWMMALPKAAAN